MLRLLCVLALTCFSCAGSGGATGRESPPCSDCASGKPIELQVQETLLRVELSPSWLRDSLRVSGRIASLPALKTDVRVVGDCAYCHALSPDGVDFDFGYRQDSLLQEWLGGDPVEILLPGALVPERDSALWAVWMDSLRSLTLPLPDRGRSVTVLERQLSRDLDGLLARIGARYGVRYLAVPQKLIVVMDRKQGKAGGYQWSLQWRFWDTREGRLLWAVDMELLCITRTDIPPDKDWAVPGIERMGRLRDEIRNYLEKGCVFCENNF